MPEFQYPETNDADETLLLAGYLKPQGRAKALDVSERTIGALILLALHRIAALPDNLAKRRGFFARGSAVQFGLLR